MGAEVGHIVGGRYRLVEALGRGGMGAVWRAHDGQLDREVAVKELLLPEHLTAPERVNWIARLDREARAAARLKHPGIVTVHDRVAGEDERPWIVTELVRGGSLADLLAAEGRLQPERAARIGLQVLDALHAAHGTGITHRDIKPANILLEPDRAVLTDFGIAALDGDATLTASGMLLGTPAFMAPEQVRGLPATAASDLWSLGATLYAAVQGRPPFEGTNPGAVLVAVATEEPQRVAGAGALAPVIDGLLRKDPAQRMTYEQLRPLLSRAAVPAPYLPTQPALAPRPAEPPRPGQPPLPPVPLGAPPLPTAAPARRGRTRRTVLIAVAALVVVAGGLGGYLLHGTHKNGDSAAYKANLRAAEQLGTPGGFSRTAETKLSGDKVRMTYATTAACGSCGGVSQTQTIVKWLQLQPDVTSIALSPRGLTTDSCHQRGDCLLHVNTAGHPRLSAVQWYVKDGHLVFQLDAG